MSFLDADAEHGIKGAVHGVTLLLSGAICLYSLAAWRQRPTTHLAVNAIVFGGVTLLEVVNVSRHQQ